MACKIKTKRLKWLAALLLLVAAMVMPATAWADEITPTQPSTGDGSAGNPYQISTAAELYWFAGLVNGTLEGVTQNKSANAVLTEDITVNEGVLDTNGNLNTGTFISWTPIGKSYENEYIGTFNGQGHTISGLYFNNGNEQYVGLFGYSMDATIQNVGVVNSYFYGRIAGGVCGHILRGTIQNCYNNSTVKGGQKIGGICGEIDGQGKILNCYNIGAIGNATNAGGVCGNKNKNAIITNCYYLSGTATGGINSADASGSAESKITDFFASGEVAYLLNEGNAFGTEVWGQQLGVNDYPVLGSDYKVIRAARGDMDANGDYPYWATFSNLNSNAELIDPMGDITVYNATVSDGTLTLAKRSDNNVSSGKGVLLKASSEYVNAKNISDYVDDATGENNLVATPEETTVIVAESGHKLYRLTYNTVGTNEALGFYWGMVIEDNQVISDDGSQLKATPNKAYLDVTTAAATGPFSAAPAYGFAFPGDGDTTGIECVSVTDESSHRNGNADGIFDLQGRKVSKPTKGVYINNGKKVIIK